MWEQLRGIATDTARDYCRAWRSLALADLAYKAVAFAALLPATMLMLRWLVFSPHNKVVADTDILRFFVTTRVGVAALIVGGAIVLAITALELACLMAIGFAAAKGTQPGVRGALVFGATRALDVLRLTAHMVVRLLAGALPFLLLIGSCLASCRHDINYYLAERRGVLGRRGPRRVDRRRAGVLLVWTSPAALALPFVVFEQVSPRGLAESARRSIGVGRSSLRRSFVVAGKPGAGDPVDGFARPSAARAAPRARWR
jgi:hypothetical protein